MAYKSNGGCTPITAKIKRTTQGGMVTQPLLDMGGPVKMKMSSPAKQTETPEETFKNEMSRQDKVKADLLAASKAKKAAKDKSNYQKSVDQYRKDVSTLNANTKTASKNVNPRQMDSAMNRNVRQANRIADFEKNLYDYDTKNKAGSTKGYTAKEYAMAKASGTYKAKTTDSSKTKDTTSSGGGTTTTTTTTKKGKKSYEQAYKDRDKKTYGKMTKAEYITEAKRQNASKKAGKGWDVKGKGKGTTKKTDTTTKATTKKTTTTNNSKATTNTKSKKKEAEKYDLTNVDGSTLYRIQKGAQKAAKKIGGTLSRAKAKKLAGDAVRKTGKAAKKQAQADAAIAAGNTRKAARKQKAADRKTIKATKKSQAAKAIQPK